MWNFSSRQRLHFFVLLEYECALPRIFHVILYAMFFSFSDQMYLLNSVAFLSLWFENDCLWLAYRISSFPEGHALKPIFNRNTLKLSYSCMPNVKNAIDAHNKAQLKKPAAEPPKNCNCRDKPNCPLNGGCRTKGIVYQATVTTPRTGPNNTNNYHSETYVGLTDTEFKLRSMHLG